MELAISAAIDIAIVLLFIIVAKRYSDLGLIRSIIGLLGNVAALVVAVIFSAQLGTYINSNYVREPMQQWFINSLSPTASDTDALLGDLDFDGLFVDRPEYFVNTLEFLNVDVDTALQQYDAYKLNGEEQARAAIVNTLTAPVASAVSRVIAFVIIFILAKIAVKILWWVSDVIINVPIVKHFDRLGGTLIGIVAAVLLTLVSVAVINISFSYLLKDMTVTQKQEIVDRTVIYRNIDKINPLNSVFDAWN